MISFRTSDSCIWASPKSQKVRFPSLMPQSQKITYGYLTKMTPVDHVLFRRAFRRAPLRRGDALPARRMGASQSVNHCSGGIPAFAASSSCPATFSAMPSILSKSRSVRTLFANSATANEESPEYQTILAEFNSSAIFASDVLRRSSSAAMRASKSIFPATSLASTCAPSAQVYDIAAAGQGAAITLRPPNRNAHSRQSRRDVCNAGFSCMALPGPVENAADFGNVFICHQKLIPPKTKARVNGPFVGFETALVAQFKTYLRRQPKCGLSEPNPRST